MDAFKKIKNQELQLEINLISAENLKSPTLLFNLNRRLRTYAIAWVNPQIKIRTTTDRLGGRNPKWGNSKFVITATTEDDVVNVEIYAVGIFKDRLIGTAQIRVGDVVSKTGGYCISSIPVYRHPSSKSGTSHGILKVGAQLMKNGGSDNMKKFLNSGSDCDDNMKKFINGGGSGGGSTWVVPSLGRKFSALSLSSG